MVELLEHIRKYRNNCEHSNILQMLESWTSRKSNLITFVEASGFQGCILTEVVQLLDSFPLFSLVTDNSLKER